MFEELPRDLANPAGLKGRTLLGQAVDLSASVHQLGISSEVPRVPSVTVSVLTLIQTCLLQSNSNPAQQHDEKKKKKALEKAYSKATLLTKAAQVLRHRKGISGASLGGEACVHPHGCNPAITEPFVRVQ